MSQRVLAVDGKAVMVDGQALSADGIIDAFITEHTEDTDIHVTAQDKNEWDAAVTKAGGAVRYDESQTLTDAQKAAARDNIGAGTPVTVDTALSGTSTNPVQNKAVKEALDGKAAGEHNHDTRYFTKTQTLKDSTATLFGLTDTAVPDDVLGWIGKYNEYWWSLQHGQAISYEHSTDRNAYPDSGTVDGITYSYLGVPFEKFPTVLQVEVGSYKGTGAYGEAYPSTLTFNFAPKLLIIMNVGEGSSTNFMMVLPSSLTDSFKNYAYWMGSVSMYSYAKMIDNKTISWHANSTLQCNISGVTYHYFAIG